MNDFMDAIRAHAARYPLMQPQDYGKITYQSEFGPEHMIANEQAAAQRIYTEWETVPPGEVPCNPEPIGNGLCRLHLTRALFTPQNAQTLARLFAQSARKHTGTLEGLENKLELLEQLPVDGIETWLIAWRRQGCPPVHHSTAFREAYRPHYRVLLEALAMDFYKQIGVSN